MKKINLLLLFFLVMISKKNMAQSTRNADVKLPKGTFVTNGKLIAKKGY